MKSPQRNRRNLAKRSAEKPSAAQNTALRLSLLYFLSGVPALLYQTVWQRLLVLHSGAGTASVSIIVAAYMLGLGLGSLLGARLSRGLTPRTSLKVFAGLELCVAAYAYFSPILLYSVLYQRFGWAYGNLWTATLLHILTLVLPTTLMGMTLPMMTGALVRESATASKSISLLYGCNTLGAAFGAALAPWFLLPYVGVSGVCSVGAALNFLVGMLAIRMLSLMPDKPTAEPVRSPSPSQTVTHGLASRPIAFHTWLALYFLSGLSSIGLEIVWFRLLDVAVKSTSYTFGTVLATFLSCMAIGSIWGARRIDRIKEPLIEFLSLQCLVAITAVAPILCLFYAPTSWLNGVWVYSYWGDADLLYPGWDRASATFVLYFILPLVVMGAPTFFMGYSFCALQKGVQLDAAQSGYRVGLLQSSNILGCTLGSLLVGLWSISVLGTADTLRVLGALSLIFAIIGWIGSGAHARFGVLFAAILIAMWMLPGGNILWMRLHGLPLDSIAKVVEDVTGVSMVAPENADAKWRLSASGKAQSHLPFGGFHSKLGALPAVIHPQPKEIAIIGLGSGDTAWAASCRTQTTNVTVFEICTSEAPVLQELAATGQWTQLKEFLEDPRIRIVGRDARHALMTDDKKYDVIEADAIRPRGAYAGYLYSIEFFQLCQRKLKPGGLMCTWVPTDGTYSTFCEVFPHIWELDGGFILIGSNDPIPADVQKWKDRIQSPEVARFLGSNVVQECLTSVDGATQTLRRFSNPMINTDLFPFDEFN